MKTKNMDLIDRFVSIVPLFVKLLEHVRMMKQKTNHSQS